MRAPRLHDVLPELLREGLITPEQDRRIRERYPLANTDQGDRTLTLFGILGALLIGLGVILVVAHNWNALPRTARTLLAFLPVLIGQGLVWYTLRHKWAVTSWREGSAIFLASALCAAMALISQIYHIHGELEGYLLVCSILILPLLYLPGSLIVTLGYLTMVTWYGGSIATGYGRDHEVPWPLIPLLAAAVPAYLRMARTNGSGTGFWWFSLGMALSVGFGSQFFYRDWGFDHVLGLMALAATFTLVPWLHHDPSPRTWPWALVGGATVLITLFVFSFRPMWEETAQDRSRAPVPDMIIIGSYGLLAVAVYLWSLRRRKPLERWPYPEAWWLFLLCFVVAFFLPALAAILVNLALLGAGVATVKHGIEKDSLRRMNLGLVIISITILARFFDGDLSFVLRGLVFIAIGIGFLYMNLRMVRRRKAQQHEA